MKAAISPKPDPTQAHASHHTPSQAPEPLRRIEDRRTADYLMDPRRGWRFFWPFLATERSPAEVARMIGAPLNQLNYHLKIMLELDLIRVTRTQARAGRPLRFYRSSFDACFVPFPQTSAESFSSLLTRNDAMWGHWLSGCVAQTWSRAGGQWGWHCFRSVERGVVVEEKPQDQRDNWNPLSANAPCVLNHWAVIPLEPAQAKDLQRDLDGLIERYQHLARMASGTGRKNHLVRAALAPIDTERS